MNFDEEVELLDPYDMPTPRRSRAAPAKIRILSARARRILLLCVGVVGSLGAAVVLNLEGGERFPPLDVRGVWVTSESRYAGRAMEIKASEVVFFTGDSTETRRYPILTVRRRVDANGLNVRIAYGEELDPLTLAILYRSSQDLRLVNQPDMTWRRESDYPKPLVVADTVTSAKGTERMSILPPELAQCITEVTKAKNSDGPVSCRSWLTTGPGADSLRDSTATH